MNHGTRSPRFLEWFALVAMHRLAWFNGSFEVVGSNGSWCRMTNVGRTDDMITLRWLDDYATMTPSDFEDLFSHECGYGLFC